MSTDDLSLIREKKQALVELQKRVAEVADYWTDLVRPYGLNDVGRDELGKLLDRFGVAIILDSMKVAVSKHVEMEDGKPTVESVNAAWNYIVKVASVKAGDLTDPHLKDIFYIRGILKNRLNYCNEKVARQLLEEAIGVGADVEALKKMAKYTRNWTAWQQEMRDLMEG